MKLSGALLVTLAFFLIGAGIAGEARAERRALQAILRLLHAMQSALSWQRVPLDRFFASFADAELEACGFLPALRGSAAGQAGFRDALSLLPLPADAGAALREFADTLGTLPLGAQCDRLSYCISRLEPILQDLTEREKNRRKSTVAVWTLIGVLLSLLLL